MGPVRYCPSSHIRPARRQLPPRIYPCHGLSSLDPSTVCLDCMRQRRQEGFRAIFVSCIMRLPLAPAHDHPGRRVALPRLRDPDLAV